MPACGQFGRWNFKACLGLITNRIDVGFLSDSIMLTDVLILIVK